MNETKNMVLLSGRSIEQTALECKEEKNIGQKLKFLRSP